MYFVVCGGRDYDKRERVFGALGRQGITENDFIVQGGAPGADELARQFAIHHCIPCITFVANWNKYGSAAGPIRNRAMAQWIRKVAPGDAQLIRFPGGRGTANMVDHAQDCGIPIVEIFDPNGHPIQAKTEA